TALYLCHDRPHERPLLLQRTYVTQPEIHTQRSGEHDPAPPLLAKPQSSSLYPCSLRAPPTSAYAGRFSMRLAASFRSRFHRPVDRTPSARPRDATRAPRGRGGSEWAQVRGFSRFSYVSTTSPILMSLKLVSVRPHSKPSRTSVASSLNRRSEAMSVSATTTPSRTSLALEFRRIEPLVTIQPAIVPNLLERNTSRTSAVP